MGNCLGNSIEINITGYCDLKKFDFKIEKNLTIEKLKEIILNKLKIENKNLDFEF
jgi:uncharacterized ubiquitin-like protein YukD